MNTMKNRYLIRSRWSGTITVVGFLLITAGVHAQTSEVVDITTYLGGQAQSVFCVGETAVFEARHNCTTAPASNSSPTYCWSGAVVDCGQAVSTNFQTTGTKTASVQCDYITVEGGAYHGEGSASILVTKVVSIDPPDSIICLTNVGSFHVTTDPVDTYDRVTMTASGATLQSFNNGVATVKFDQLSADNSDASLKTVTASCGTNVSARIRVVEVGSLTQISPSTSVVCVGTPVEFQVETNPEENYEAVDVTCTVAATVNYNPTNGVATVTFNQGSDNAIVRADCGPYPWITSTVVVDVGPINSTCTNRLGADGGNMVLWVNPVPQNRPIEWRFAGNSQVLGTGTTFTVTGGSADGFFTVTASDRDLPSCSASFQIEVVGHCGANYPWQNFDYSSTDEGRPANCGGDMALFEPPPFGVAITGAYTACHGVISNTTAWFPRVTGIGFTYYKEVCCGNRTAITNATMVTSDDFCNGILAEFAPPGAYTNYCAPTCLQDFVDSADEAYWQICTNKWAQGEPIVESKTKPFVCIERDTVAEAEHDLEDDVNSALQAVYSLIMSEWNNQFAEIEAEAYAREAACLSVLEGDIEDRADSNNWTCQ
jgi:hypothetical protein